MKVKVLSLSEVLHYQTKNKASIIRIGDTDSDLPELQQDYKHCCILKFYDIEPKPSLPSNWNWFNKTQGETLLAFFKTIEDSEELIIHCHAGISRSPAVALAYAWYKEDKSLENDILNGKYIPNPQVLKVMSKLIGNYKEKSGLVHSFMTIVQLAKGE